MLLDTSGLLCLYHQSELFHQQAVQAYKATQVRLTHSYVLAEFVALATARRFPRVPVLEYLGALMDNPDIDLVWIDEQIYRAEALKFSQNSSPIPDDPNQAEAKKKLEEELTKTEQTIKRGPIVTVVVGLGGFGACILARSQSTGAPDESALTFLLVTVFVMFIFTLIALIFIGRTINRQKQRRSEIVQQLKVFSNKL